MAVYFKFRSAKDFDSVSIDGHFISLAHLKQKIVEQKKLGTRPDYHLVISNAQTNEEYTDEGFLVPELTSVIVRRVARRPSIPIVADVRDERKSSVGVLPVSSGFQPKNTLQSSAPDGLDDFGDVYAVPEVVQAPTASVTEEDNIIQAFVDASAKDLQQQIQESYSGGKGNGNKGQGRGLPLRGGFARGFENKNPPHGYVCHRCSVTGHYIQQCPTNGDPTYDLKKVRPRPILDIPPELCCPLCKGVLTEAVLAGKCCFKSYCDKCVRNEIISKAKCACGAKNILADDLVPNRTLRDAINKFLESQVSAVASTGNVGSRAQLPDMESAPYTRPKMTSPVLSVSLKASSVTVASNGSDTDKPFAGRKGFLPKLAEASSGQGPKTESGSGIRFRFQNEAAAIDPLKQGMEVIDGSPKSEVTEESVQEAVSAERSVRIDTEPQDQGPTISEPVKGEKKPKGKRARHDIAYSDGMWGQGPNYNSNSQLQAKNYCMNCGSYEHPFWNCHLTNGPWPSYHAPSMQGPIFGPGFNPQMQGMMHQPYHQNPGPYSAYRFSPYDFPFSGPMIPPPEGFSPPAGRPNLPIKPRRNR